MDYSKLTPKVAAVLAEHPDWTDQQVADSLNAATVVVQGPVTSRQAMRWAASTDAIFVLEEAGKSGNKDTRKLARAFLMTLNHPHITDVDVSGAEIIALLDGLVTQAVFTQAEVNGLKARGQSTVSRAEELGLGHVALADIEIAAGHRPLVQHQED